MLLDTDDVEPGAGKQPGGPFTTWPQPQDYDINLGRHRLKLLDFALARPERKPLPTRALGELWRRCPGA
jgi:hypothetical protein